MKLDVHCKKVAKQLKNETFNKQDALLSDEKKYKEILKLINKHHIQFTVLRSYAAILLHEKSSRKKISLKNLCQILSEDDVVTPGDIDNGLNRLIAQGLISLKGGYYSITKK